MKNISDLVLLHHILDAINEIFRFTQNSSSVFYDNDLVKRAVSKDFEIIGEAAARLSSVFKSKYPETPWQKIKDFRNVLVHDYFDIDYDAMWQIIETRLPELKSQIEFMITKTT